MAKQATAKTPEVAPQTTFEKITVTAKRTG
jgi:hypothetical protein